MLVFHIDVILLYKIHFYLKPIWSLLDILINQYVCCICNKALDYFDPNSFFKEMRESATSMHNRLHDVQDLTIFYLHFLFIDGSLMYICYQISTMSLHHTINSLFKISTNLFDNIASTRIKSYVSAVYVSYHYILKIQKKIFY